MNSSQRLRTRVVLGAVVCAASALIVALYYIAVVNGDKYTAKADAQYAGPSSTLFDRGAIYFTAHASDSSKTPVRTTAAAVGSGYLVYMNPQLMRDPAGAYQAVSQYLELDKNSFLAKAAKANDPYEELARRIDQASADSVRKLGVPGIGVLPETWRSYPGGTMAAHALGLVGEDSETGKVAGRYGLERYYDAVLARTASSKGNAIAKLFSDVTGTVFGSGDGETGDIVTTIEPSVERYLERTLAETDALWHPDEIGGIIIDPNTGEIFAMASLPSYDPNNTAAVKNVSIFSDPLVENVYEMGSIMKPLTMAAALDSGAVRATTVYDDTGCMTLDKKKICNFDQRARGPGTSMQAILSQSLNVGASTIALETGATEFIRYLESFGIGAKTGIDLPNESAPLTGNLKKGSDINVATASYGHGISVSPIGIARALSVLANGGHVITPRLVKEINYSDGTVKEVATEKSGPVLKAETLAEVSKMLTKVVDESLKGGKIKNERYTIAAKTGTASIADPVNGGYYTDRYLHSFFGYFPATNPRFLVFLYQVHPKGAQYASDTLTEPFDGLATFLLNYYNIPPDR